MKKKIKDLTKEEANGFCKWHDNCYACPFCFGDTNSPSCFVGMLFHKKSCALLKDEFLNKEVEVDNPKTILDQVEHDYLEAVINPFRDRIIYIQKCNELYKHKYQYVNISLNLFKTGFYDSVDLPMFKKETLYKNMKVNRQYTLEELGL